MYFRKIDIKSGIYFRKIGIKSGIHLGKIGIRNGYVFETSMARPRPKSGQVPPPPPGMLNRQNNGEDGKTKSTQR